MAAVVALTVRLIPACGSAGRVVQVPSQAVAPVIVAPPSVAVVPAGVSRLPAGESHDLRAPQSRPGRDDRDDRVRGLRPVGLVDDRDVIFARSADAVGGQVDAVWVLDRNRFDLPRRAEGERLDAVSLRGDRIAPAAAAGSGTIVAV